MLRLETYSAHSVNRTAPRGASIGLITLLHLAAGYALVTALGYVPPPKIPTIMTVRNIEPPPKTDDLPPPPLPVIERPPPFVPITPEVELAIEPAPANTVSLPEQRPVPDTPRTEYVPPVAITPARSIAGTHTIPEYPILSRRLAEQGTVRLRLIIGEDGMVAEAQVTRSSGFKRLDDAALAWVLMHWRYQPAMRGAMPVRSQTEASLQFKLQ